ncbi:hypothetical protein SAMN05443253_101385 [Bacillus sp. OK048]|nr:hypothetical protein SAMN05443253_101385 [Bacillus sp. OK048]
MPTNFYTKENTQDKLGVTSDELAEAIMIASAVRAGGSYA